MKVLGALHHLRVPMGSSSVAVGRPPVLMGGLERAACKEQEAGSLGASSEVVCYILTLCSKCTLIIQRFQLRKLRQGEGNPGIKLGS